VKGAKRMKCYITRTSDYDFYSVVEVDHLEDCLRVLRTFGYPFVVSFITEDDKKYRTDRFESLDYDEDGSFEILYDKKRAESYESCDFEVEIYDGYRE
jgi:hypothetical protein